MKFKFVSLLNVVAVCALLLGAVSCKPTEDNVKPGTYDSEKSYAVSYCSNTISSGIGMQVEAQMGAAVKMPAYMLTDGGNHIVAVRVALLTESRDCEMFITRSLDGEPIVKKSFTPIIGTWTYVALDAPLEVTGTEDYYIGYTTTTSGYCLGFESGNRTSTNDLVYSNGEWVTLADLNLKGKLSIQAMMVGGDYSNIAPQTDLGVESLQAPKYVKVGDPVSMSCIIINNGVNSVGSFDITYTYGGSSQTVTMANGLKGGETYVFTVPVTTALSTAQNTTIKVEVSASGDEVAKNNSVSKSQLIYDRTFERNILVEQFTGQSCGNCPSGTTTINNALADYAGRYVRVAHHVGYYEDDFTIAASKTLTGLFNSNGTFAPAVSVDRTHYSELGADGPAMSVGYMTKSLVAEALAAPSSATVNIARTFDETTRELSVTVSGEVLSSVANPCVSVYLVQDGIVAYQASGGNSYVHNRAIRASLAANNWGDPVTVGADGTYTATYTYTVPESVGDFACVLTDMDVQAFITNHGSSVVTRQVENAAEVSLLESAAPSAMRLLMYETPAERKLSAFEQGCFMNR